MAITFKETTHGQAANKTGITVPFTCTASSDSILIIGIGSSDSVPRAVSTVTYNGDTCYSIGGGNDSSNSSCELWYRVGPDTGGSYNIVVTMASKCDEIIVCAWTYEGVDQTSPYDTAAFNSGDSTKASVDVTNSATGDLVVSTYYNLTTDTTSGDCDNTYIDHDVIAGPWGGIV